jgi:hypothetical protein
MEEWEKRREELRKQKSTRKTKINNNTQSYMEK